MRITHVFMYDNPPVAGPGTTDVLPSHEMYNHRREVMSSLSEENRQQVWDLYIISSLAAKTL